MTYYLRNSHVYKDGGFLEGDLFLSDGTLVSSFEGVPSVTIDNAYIFPGFADVHVHLREPGFSYKETVATGSAAGAHGGYVHLVTMPNLNPVPDSIPHLNEQRALIERDAVVNVYPLGSITVGEKGEQLSDIAGMAPYVVGYSDDGRGVQSEEMMRSAMLEIKKTGKILAAHCEVNDLLFGGYIHDGKYCAEHGHKGICSESEWREVERDIALSKETGCPLHICHISTKETVELVRRAKAEGVDVTCETGPHYLVLSDKDLKEEGRFKMNPPLRDESDRLALIEGVKDGTIDMISTDHAPHSAEEKSRGLAGSLMGVVGLETAFAECYTHLVKTGVITLEKLIELMCVAPRKRFGLCEGDEKSFCIFDLEKEYTVDPVDFLSMGKSSPFTGDKVYGECLVTVVNGKAVYEKSNI